MTLFFNLVTLKVNRPFRSVQQFCLKIIKCNLFFRSLIESAGDLMKNDIADDFE